MFLNPEKFLFFRVHRRESRTSHSLVDLIRDSLRCQSYCLHEQNFVSKRRFVVLDPQKHKFRLLCHFDDGLDRSILLLQK